MAQSDLHKVKQSFVIAAMLVSTLWVVNALLMIFHLDPGMFGIVPRDIHGLWGILSSPLVHDGWYHLIANTGPIFFFAAGMFYFYRDASRRAVIWIYLMTGIWVWVAAHDGSHIGASGLVYGFGAFLFFSGVFRRDVRSIAVSLVIAFFYGGMVWGVLPGQTGISWESHLFGAIAGIATSFYFRNFGVQPRKRYSWDIEPETDTHDDKAIWNYRQNWSGANTVYMPSDSGSEDSPSGKL